MLPVVEKKTGCPDVPDPFARKERPRSPDTWTRGSESQVDSGEIFAGGAD
jgi:hypothetical protein